MDDLSTREAEVQCPFCGEPITVVVDCSEETQTYIEDCEVCCRPIEFTVSEHGQTVHARK